MEAPTKNRNYWTTLRLYMVYRLWSDGNKSFVGITDNVDKWLEHVNEVNETNESLDAFEIKDVFANIYNERGE